MEHIALLIGRLLNFLLACKEEIHLAAALATLCEKLFVLLRFTFAAVRFIADSLFRLVRTLIRRLRSLRSCGGPIVLINTEEITNAIPDCNGPVQRWERIYDTGNGGLSGKSTSANAPYAAKPAPHMLC